LLAKLGSLSERCSGGSFRKKMAELPKDESTVESAFLFVAPERIFLWRIIR
jgi:hypothetical protein